MFIFIRNIYSDTSTSNRAPEKPKSSCNHTLTIVYKDKNRTNQQQQQKTAKEEKEKQTPSI